MSPIETLHMRWRIRLNLWVHKRGWHNALPNPTWCLICESET